MYDKRNIVVSEGFRRGVLSQGGKEEFQLASLVGHVNWCHVNLRHKPLRFITRTEEEKKAAEEAKRLGRKKLTVSRRGTSSSSSTSPATKPSSTATTNPG